MAQKMLSYIHSQPEIWADCCKKLPQMVCREAEKMHNAVPVNRLVIVGTGSSYYAAETVVCLLREEAEVKGIEMFSAVPTRMGVFANPKPGVLYWVVSQSGKSTSTEQTAKILREKGAPVWSVTSDETSPLAHCTDGHVLIPCGEETVGPKTKGMTSTILALWLLGKALLSSENVTESVSCLMPAFAQARENIRLSEQWVAQCIQVVKETPCLTVIADGKALPLAQEGALKLLETLYVPAGTWEFEEYLHGVNNIIGPNMTHLFLVHDTQNRQRMEMLIEYCRDRGALCLVIDCAAEKAGVEGMRLSLKCTGRTETLAYEALIPFQVLSAVGSEAKGIECDRPHYPDFYAALGTKVGAK